MIAAATTHDTTIPTIAPIERGPLPDSVGVITSCGCIVGYGDIVGGQTAGFVGHDCVGGRVGGYDGEEVAVVGGGSVKSDQLAERMGEKRRKSAIFYQLFQAICGRDRYQKVYRYKKIERNDLISNYFFI